MAEEDDQDFIGYAGRDGGKAMMADMEQEKQWKLLPEPGEEERAQESRHGQGGQGSESGGKDEKRREKKSKDKDKKRSKVCLCACAFMRCPSSPWRVQPPPPPTPPLLTRALAACAYARTHAHAQIDKHNAFSQRDARHPNEQKRMRLTIMHGQCSPRRVFSTNRKLTHTKTY